MYLPHRFSWSRLVLPALVPALLLLLPGCSGKGDAADDSAGNGELTVLVNAPSPSATYHANQPVPFEVIARLDGSPIDITHATWTLDADAQTKEGATGEFDLMTAGDHTVNVEVRANGETSTRDVSFTVSPEGDADTDTDSDTDTDADTDTDTDADFSYTGSISATIDYHGEWGDFGTPCPGLLNYTVDASGTIAGLGNCTTTEGGYDFPFTMEGRTTGDVSGVLIMTYDGNEARTPFAGRGAAGNTMNADFDTTQTYGSDTVRIYGSWTADPV